MTFLKNSDQWYTFISALQLSIKTKIKFIDEDNNDLKIHFDKPPPADDKNFNRFTELLKGDWIDDDKCYVIHSANKIDWQKMTLFLLLTRLDEKNIIKLVQIDKSFRDIAIEKLGISSANVENIKHCSEIIFKKMKEKGITYRQLAESTGLTQVTISNFKSGKDIKLSNLIKIIQVLELDLKIV